ncbi:hypothetical protein [Pacificimonas flava]|uniref:hypothetical protein n=1 Tax=Pacificimonas flava TaxID=1234595 RepID=UPI00122E3256|nr:hypothetical protein [Pacificimonas flava]MBB5279128.1 hypothetical protein [Pacificimonas flava]
MLLERAQRLSTRALAIKGKRQAMVGDAHRELHLAESWHLRRSAVQGSVDNRVYAHGSAEQALGALDLCPIAALGFKSAGALTYPWLLDAAAEMPGGTYCDHMRIALENAEIRRFCTALGCWHRFQWKRSVYQRELLTWSRKAIAQDPNARWRRRSVTLRQRYLVDLIIECLTALHPDFRAPPLEKRGDAHDFIRDFGGNPVFWHQPSRPHFEFFERI